MRASWGGWPSAWRRSARRGGVDHGAGGVAVARGGARAVGASSAARDGAPRRRRCSRRRSRIRGSTTTSATSCRASCGEAYLAPGADAGRALAFVERARAAGQPLPLDGAAFRQLLRAERRFLDVVVALDAAATEARDPAERAAARARGGRGARARSRPRRRRRPSLRRALRSPSDAARAGDARAPGLRRRQRAHLRAGHPRSRAQAGQRAARLVERARELAQLKIVRGELLLQAGADAEAEAEFLHALITTPRVGRAHAALADVYKKRNDLAGALEHLIAAADAPDLEPMRAAACAVDAADVLLVEGDSATAERLYQLAAALDPADRRPVDALARLAGGARRSRAPRRSARAAPPRSPPIGASARAWRCSGRACSRRSSSASSTPIAPSKRRSRAIRTCAKRRGRCARWPRRAASGRSPPSSAIASWRSPPTRSSARGCTSSSAQLLENKLLDGAAALRNYEQAAELALDAGAPPDVAPWSDLVRLYSEAQRWRDAALAAERLAASLSGAHRGGDQQAARAEALQRAGELHERAGDHERARQRLAEAAAIGGEAGRKADDSLLRLAEDEGDPGRAAPSHRGAARRRARRRSAPRALAARSWSSPRASAISAEVDARSQEILARAPDDAEAFVQRKHVLDRAQRLGRRWRSCCARAPPPSTIRPSAPSAASRPAAWPRASCTTSPPRPTTTRPRSPPSRSIWPRSTRSPISHIARATCRARARSTRSSASIRRRRRSAPTRSGAVAASSPKRPATSTRRASPTARPSTSIRRTCRRIRRWRGCRSARGDDAARLSGAARGARSVAARRRRAHHRAAPPSRRAGLQARRSPGGAPLPRARAVAAADGGARARAAGAHLHRAAVVARGGRRARPPVAPGARAGGARRAAVPSRRGAAPRARRPRAAPTTPT